MPSFIWNFWVAFGLMFALGWIVTTWIRARHGYPLDDGAGGRVYRHGPPAADVAKQVQEALAERDALIVKLEARIRVLERIVTDEPTRLGAEIERLRS